MGDKAKISWLGPNGKTFSPWLGCHHATMPWTDDPHPGCMNCYAESMRGKFGVQWGPASEGGTRRRTAESTWRRVETWNRIAGLSIESARGNIEKVESLAYAGLTEEYRKSVSWELDRPRVFPSACDPFEEWSWPILNANGETLYRLHCGKYESLKPGQFFLDSREPARIDDVRRDFFALIDRTQNLDWLLLTKRPENVQRMWPISGARGNYETHDQDPEYYRSNVWLLYSASDQRSMESGLPYMLECRDLVPVLGLSLEPLVGPVDLSRKLFGWDPITGRHDAAGYCDRPHKPDWVIVGGESGPHARPCEVSWIRDIVDQCRNAGVPCFVKQDAGRYQGQQGRIPDDLWSVKEFPR